MINQTYTDAILKHASFIFLAIRCNDETNALHWIFQFFVIILINKMINKYYFCELILGDVSVKNWPLRSSAPFRIHAINYSFICSHYFRYKNNKLYKKTFKNNIIILY